MQTHLNINQERKTSFDELNEQQQTQVLHYLQAINNEDIQAATELLSSLNFDVNHAISSHFGGTSSSRITNDTRQPTAEQRRELQEYIRHLQNILREKTLWKLLFGATKSLVKGTLRTLSNYLLPQCVKQRLLYSKFERVYRSVSQVKFEVRSLEEATLNGRNHEKMVALFIGSNDKMQRGLMRVLNSSDLDDILNRRFICYGTTIDHAQLRQVAGEQLQAPALVLLYLTIFDKCRVLHTFQLPESSEDTLPVSKQQLERVIEQYRAERRHEKNIIIRYNNLVLQQFHDEAATDLMEDELPQDTHNTYATDRQMIKQQEKEYQQAVEESRRQEQKRKKEQQEQRKLEQELMERQEERKIRKMSIPQEPQEGEFVRLQFRCPSGSKITRNFSKCQLLQLVYNWVETNDDIEFEDEKRQFELLYGYPPKPLGQRKLDKLSEVFEQEQELLLIREL